MITVYSACSFVVSNSPTELGFSAGTYVIPEARLLRPLTNAYVDFSALRDGSSITIDLAGSYYVTEAPNLGVVAMQGFILAGVVVGLFLVSRWAIKAFSGGVVE